MLALILFLIHLLIDRSIGKCWCDYGGYELVGEYCYYIDVAEDHVQPTLFEQQLTCAEIGGFLPFWDKPEDKQALLDAVNDKVRANFNSFFIGLECDIAENRWMWINPRIPYSDFLASFQDLRYDPINCYNSNVSFLQSPSGKWKELSSFPDDFSPVIAVCQRTPASDDGYCTSTELPSTNNTALIIGLCSAILILILIVILVIWRLRSNLKSKQMLEKQLKQKSEDATSQSGKDVGQIKDDWEIGRQCVEICFADKLGTGAFGVVYMEYADKLAEFEFLQEIELMKSIGYHERLVNIIACVTESSPRLLVTEFCDEGDLLTRGYMLQLNPDSYLNLVDKSLIITQEHQLQYAVQIALGLEYLSSRGYIHRDIAARNILVDSKSGCKVGDFGLCRRVEEQQELYQSRGGRLPIKWMAPEALRRYEMSTASDVWSYGVLLFEIITLGGSPYPSWEPTQILPRLEAGERMARPDNCPDSIFETMNECWNSEPAKRPSFAELRLRTAKMIAECPSEYYLQLDAQRDYYLVPRSRDLPVLEEEIFRIN